MTVFLAAIMCWYLCQCLFIVLTNMFLFNQENKTYIITDKTTDFYEKVFYSIKTTGAYHKSRLQILIDTWIPIVMNQVCAYMYSSLRVTKNNVVDDLSLRYIF